MQKVSYNKGLCENADLNRTSTCSEQENNKLLHKKCAICVHQRKEDSGISKIVSVWPTLPEHVKKSIMTLIETCISKE